MEQNKEEKVIMVESNKEGCLKYILIVISTLIGSFLAFYFVADFSIKMMLSPEHQMRRAEKMMQKMDREFMRDMNKDIGVIGKTMSNPVKIEKVDNNYIVEITLKQFGNNSGNVKVSSEDNEILKIEANNEVKKGDRENLTSMVQTYKLDKSFDFTKKTEKEENGKLIITLPIKE